MLRIGLLGASRISRGAILEPAAEIGDIEVTRVAARQPARARAFADEHAIAGIERDYEALCMSDEVDLVYNGLPPSEHARWSIAALEAGKHVLCEKPFARNADEAQRMVDVSNRSGPLLIEAFHYRFHPLFDRVLQVIDSGELGAIQRIDSHFYVPIKFRPDEIRYDRTLGGGSMMDLGCYPLHWARTVMRAEPEVLSAEAEWHESGVDVAMRAELDFGGSVRASISSAMSERLPDVRDVALAVKGDSGELYVENPVSPHNGHRLEIRTRTARGTEEVAGSTTYFHQLQHLLAVLRGDAAPLTGGADAVGNMRALDCIYALADHANSQSS